MPLAERNSQRPPLSVTVAVPNGNLDGLQTSAGPTTTQRRTLSASTNRSLKTGWQRAQAKFKEDTGLELGSLGNKSSTGMLGTWEQKYKVSGLDKHRREEMKDVLEHILKGIEVVGAFTAPVATGVFPPANACFNAFEILLTAQMEIRKMWDTLKELFFEIKFWLVKFKIYERLDDIYTLDESLVEYTNNVLMSLVKICGIATKMLKAGKRTTWKVNAKVVLCKDDGGLSVELGRFRHLIEQQGSLSDAIELAVVLKSAEDTRKILKKADSLSKSVAELVAYNKKKMSREANQNRLEEIEKKLFNKKPLQRDEKEISYGSDELLDGTFEAVSKTDAYSAWSTDTESSILVISGPSGSGKSRILESIMEHLYIEQEKDEGSDPAIYVASHRFANPKVGREGQRKTDDSGRFLGGRGTSVSGSSLIRGVSILACQIAMQSIAYASLLQQKLRTTKKSSVQDELEGVFKKTLLGSFTVDHPSELYILLDAVECEGFDGMKKFMDMLHDNRKELGSFPKVKTILSIDYSKAEVDRLLGRKKYHNISSVEVGKALLGPFIASQMQLHQLFQDPDHHSRQLKRKCVDKLSNCGDIAFDKIRRKFNNLKDAIDTGRPREDLDEILQDFGTTDDFENAKAILRDMERTLKVADLKRLGVIIAWLLVSNTMWSIDAIEAALHLEGISLPIDALASRIRDRFSKVLNVRGDYVELQPKFMTYLTETWKQPVTESIHASEPRISITLTLQNATKLDVRRFAGALDELLFKNNLEPDNVTPSGTSLLKFDRLKVHLRVVHLCLKIMNEGWDETTAIMVDYASTNFAAHISALSDMKNKIDPTDRKAITQGLIAFLTEPSIFASKHESYDYEWISNPVLTSAVRSWLADEATQKELSPIERKWVKRVLDPAAGPLGFLEDQAVAIGERWLTDPRSSSAMLFCWLDTYLNAIEEAKDLEAGKVQCKERSRDEDEFPFEQNEILNVSRRDNVLDREKVRGDMLQSADAECESPTVPDAMSLAVEFPLNSTSNDNIGPDLCNVTTESTVDEPTASTPGKRIADDERNKNEDGDKDNNDDNDDDDDDEDQEIERAKAWLNQRRAVPQGSACHLSLAHTYRSLYGLKQALKYYKIGAEDQQLKHYALHGLALCHYYNDDPEKLMAQLAGQSIAAFGSLYEKGDLDGFDKDQFFRILNTWIWIFEDKQKFKDALVLSKTAWELKPTDLSCFWRMAKLHCLVCETQDEAFRLLAEWNDPDEKHAGQTPVSSLIDMTDKEVYHIMCKLCLNVRNESLRECLLDYVLKALERVERNAAGTTRARLTYLQAVLCKFSDQPKHQRNVSQYLQDVLNAKQTTDAYEDDIVDIQVQALLCLVKMEFEKNRAKLSCESTNRDSIHRDFENYLEEICKTTLCVTDDQGPDSVHGFLTAFRVLAEMDKTTFRSLCTSDVGRGLNLLSDSNPDNDNAGVTHLARSFCRLGDTSGALSAFSLLDRRIVQGRMNDESAAFVDTAERNSGLCRSCDGCEKAIYSSDPDGMWWCQFCPNFDLCSECKDKQERRELRMMVCDPSHLPYYLHLVHRNYAPEDLDQNKVRVGWECRDEGNGKSSRTGGQVVDVKVWLAQIREEWNLPEPVLMVPVVQT